MKRPRVVFVVAAGVFRHYTFFMMITPANDNELYDRIVECLAMGTFLRLHHSEVMYFFSATPSYTINHERRYSLLQSLVKLEQKRTPPD